MFEEEKAVIEQNLEDISNVIFKAGKFNPNDTLGFMYFTMLYLYKYCKELEDYIEQVKCTC